MMMVSLLVNSFLQPLFALDASTVAASLQTTKAVSSNQLQDTAISDVPAKMAIVVADQLQSDVLTTTTTPSKTTSVVPTVKSATQTPTTEQTTASDKAPTTCLAVEACN